MIIFINQFFLTIYSIQTQKAVKDGERYVVEQWKGVVFADD